MNRQNITTFLFALMLSMVGTTASAHDIEVTTDGVTIYYVWTNGNTELQVSFQGNSYYAYPNEYSGSVVIPAEVTYGGVTYPVTSIGNRAFEGCSKLTSVTIGNSVTTIGNAAFEECDGLTSVTIGNSVTTIGDEAFYDCSNLMSITFPNSVTSIGTDAFYDCSSLTSIVIPKSVTSIREGAFNSCSGLTSIIVEGGNPVFDSRDNCNAIIYTPSNQLIVGCNTTTIPNSVWDIGMYAFVGCPGLTNITIPNSVTSIGDAAFLACPGLTSIIVEGGNPVYDSREDCNAIIHTATNTLLVGCQNTIIPNSVTSIDMAAFYGCTGLTSITIPNSVTSIKYAAFGLCHGLTSVDIPNSVTSIGLMAFGYCSGLTSVTIGNSVTSIGEAAFGACEALTDVYCYALSVPTTESDAFESSSYDSSATLHVPAASIELYRAAEPWKDFSKIEAIIVEKLVAALVPSNNNRLVLADSNGETLLDAVKPAIISIDKGEDYVVRAYSSSTQMKTNLFVNGEDRTEELVDNTVDGYDVKELSLENVEENLVIESRYIRKNFDVVVSSTEGGEARMYFVDSSDGNTYSAFINNQNYLLNFIQYGTDVRFVITPNQGYELGFVVSGSIRSIGEGEDVVPLDDGSYQFILPASGFYDGHADVTIYFKKKGGSNDVNGDGVFNIADVTTLVNMLLGK